MKTKYFDNKTVKSTQYCKTKLIMPTQFDIPFFGNVIL